MEFTDILLLQITLLISLKGFTSWPTDTFLSDDCSKTYCGDIKIEYPFGIGTSCSYAIEFNLTCSHVSNPPKLLLGDGNIQVKQFDIQEGLVYIESPYATLNADEQFINTTLIDLKNLPLSFSSDLVYLKNTSRYPNEGRTTLIVVGCSAITNIIDLVNDSTIDVCITMCSTINTSTIEQRYLSKHRHCSIDLDSERFSQFSWAIKLTRLNGNLDHMIINSTSSITAIIYNEYTDNDDVKRFIEQGNRTGMITVLGWYLNDYSTCKEAMQRNDTYACRSRKSECYDVGKGPLRWNKTIGYICQCSSHYVGNPYIHDGCQLGKNFTITPGKDCPTKCGNITILFPFGLKQGCYRDDQFYTLTCNETSHLLYLYDNDRIVSKISLKEGQLEYSVSYDPEKETRVINWVVDYQSCLDAAKDNSTFACISKHSSCLDVNVEGHGNYGYRCICKDGYDGNPYLHDGCQGTNFTITPGKDCPTKCGNITISFPFGLKQGCYREEYYALTCNETSHLLYWDNNGGVVSGFSLKEGQLKYNSVSYDHDKETRVINWTLGEQSCNDAANDNLTFACISKYSSCLDVKNEVNENEGYRCICKDGYDGNPYLHDYGCIDIDECSFIPNICTGDCINTEGSYNCTCPPGTSGDPYRGVCLHHKRNSLLLGVILGASIGTSLLLLCITLVIAGKKWKQKNQKKIKKRNFLRNHGLLLQQLISTSDNRVEGRTHIFSLEEIEKATNNFDETRVLGKGGYGTVYKGILSNQQVVAIKKSKIVKTSEIDQFINEVAILSQINHRNVVKLLGCCLETEVPLLIYEFISNGTLFEHLHVSQSESKLSWDDRLRIATESAGALAYLHSAASMSVFHRDVKSSNILLDDTFKAKVSDFGASRFIPLDQTHIVTTIQGTFGYIDPEYYQTSWLTEKSDVYSFGIILLELLTGKKPIYSIENGLQQNLAMNFLQAIKENMLLDLLEDRVLQEGTKQEFLEISSLIEICLNLNGTKRPTMKEVEYKLQSMRKIRMKKKRVCILEGNEETECLLTVSSQSSSELLDQISQGNSRNYSFEKELMWSQNCAR